MAKADLSFRSILGFAFRAACIFAVGVVAWSFLVGPYTVLPAAAGNRILHLGGIDTVTSIGRSASPEYDIAVFHRDAAGTADSLFDFRIQSLRTDIPMLVALVLAMPLPWSRRVIALLFGAVLVILAESFAATLVMTWSYLTLPDHQNFSPFHYGRAATVCVDYLYKAYNEFGPALVPIVAWLIVAVRLKDLGAGETRKAKEKER